MQIGLIITRKFSHWASFWKWKILKLGNIAYWNSCRRRMCKRRRLWVNSPLRLNWQQVTADFRAPESHWSSSGLNCRYRFKFLALAINMYCFVNIVSELVIRSSEWTFECCKGFFFNQCFWAQNAANMHPTFDCSIVPGHFDKQWRIQTFRYGVGLRSFPWIRHL